MLYQASSLKNAFLADAAWTMAQPELGEAVVGLAPASL